MDRPELETDPQLDTVLKRADRMKDLVIPAFEAWASDKDRHQTVEALRLAGQPAGIVQSIDEVRACPQLAHRGLFAPMQDDRLRRPDGSSPALPRLPLLVDGRAASPGVVPRLGADNDDLLALEEAER